MQTNVSTLLREFPKVRKAAFRGERIVIATREGNLILMAEKPPGAGILGALKGKLRIPPTVDLTKPTSCETEWMP